MNHLNLNIASNILAGFGSQALWEIPFSVIPDTLKGVDGYFHGSLQKYEAVKPLESREVAVLHPEDNGAGVGRPPADDKVEITGVVGQPEATPSQGVEQPAKAPSLTTKYTNSVGRFVGLMLTSHLMADRPESFREVPGKVIRSIPGPSDAKAAFVSNQGAAAAGLVRSTLRTGQGLYTFGTSSAKLLGRAVSDGPDPLEMRGKQQQVIAIEQRVGQLEQMMMQLGKKHKELGDQIRCIVAADLVDNAKALNVLVPIWEKIPNDTMKDYAADPEKWKEAFDTFLTEQGVAEEDVRAAVIKAMERLDTERVKGIITTRDQLNVMFEGIKPELAGLHHQRQGIIDSVSTQQQEPTGQLVKQLLTSSVSTVTGLLTTAGWLSHYLTANARKATVGLKDPTATVPDLLYLPQMQPMTPQSCLLQGVSDVTRNAVDYGLKAGAIAVAGKKAINLAKTIGHGVRSWWHNDAERKALHRAMAAHEWDGFTDGLHTYALTAAMQDVASTSVTEGLGGWVPDAAKGALSAVALPAYHWWYGKSPGAEATTTLSPAAVGRWVLATPAIIKSTYDLGMIGVNAVREHRTDDAVIKAEFAKRKVERWDSLKKDGKWLFFNLAAYIYRYETARMADGIDFANDAQRYGVKAAISARQLGVPNMRDETLAPLVAKTRAFDWNACQTTGIEDTSSKQYQDHTTLNKIFAERLRPVVESDDLVGSKAKAAKAARKKMMLILHNDKHPELSEQCHAAGKTMLHWTEHVQSIANSLEGTGKCEPTPLTDV